MNYTTIPRKNTIRVGVDTGPSPLTDAKTAAVSGMVKVYADSFANIASTGVTFAAGTGTLIVDTDVT